MSGRVYRRWDKCQIRQHQLLILATTLLVLTGLPLRYARLGSVQFVVRLFGGPEVAGALHRLGAVLLLTVTVWHVLYLIGRWRLARLDGSMMPAVQDVKDVVQTARYLFGLRDDEPPRDRYSFIEKFEYWAVVWGSAIMLLSGAILWFPVLAARAVSGMGIELAKVIHGYEALLAALSIAIWHMYHAHLRHDVFPMNRVWLTGTLTEEEMRHHHPLELARLHQQEAAAAAAAAAADTGQDDAAAQAADTTAPTTAELDRPPNPGADELQSSADAVADGDDGDEAEPDDQPGAGDQPGGGGR